MFIAELQKIAQRTLYIFVLVEDFFDVKTKKTANKLNVSYIFNGLFPDRFFVVHDKADHINAGNNNFYNRIS